MSVFAKRSSFGAFLFGMVDETQFAKEQFRHEALMRARAIANKLRGEETYGLTSRSKKWRSLWSVLGGTPISDTSPARLAAERSAHRRNSRT